MATEVGRRIALYLEMKDMTQKELAIKTGVTEAAISRYVNSDREPRAITVAAIAKALDVSVNDLLGMEADDLDEAYQMVARNAKSISEKKRKELIKILLDN